MYHEPAGKWNNGTLFANRVLDKCGSTNDIAKALGEQGFPHGTWVSTRIQEAGRGRLGRKWESLEGNLFLSILTRIENKALWSWVPLTSAIGVVRCLNRKYPGINFQVKWPNDLWLGGAKLGGFLCEGSGGNASDFIVIGLGLNCLFAPDHLDQKTMDLTTAVGKGPLSADEVRAPILESILNELEDLKTNGPQAICEKYESCAAFPSGTLIEWGLPPQTGRIEGLGPASELIVRTTRIGEGQTNPGSLLSLYAEDVKIKLQK